VFVAGMFSKKMVRISNSTVCIRGRCAIMWVAGRSLPAQEGRGSDICLSSIASKAKEEALTVSLTFCG